MYQKYSQKFLSQTRNDLLSFSTYPVIVYLKDIGTVQETQVFLNKLLKDFSFEYISSEELVGMGDNDARFMVETLRSGNPFSFQNGNVLFPQQYIVISPPESLVQVIASLAMYEIDEGKND